MTAAINRRNRRAQARSRRRAGRKTTQIGASATTTWGYDSSDRLQYLRSGSLTRFTYSYDNNSNLKTVEDLIGSRSTYLYDAKNRLTQDASSGTNAHTYDYSYDSRDNRTYSGEEGQWQFAYDAANRLVTAVNAGEDPEPVLTFTYDDNGNMTRIEDSIAGTTTMAYDCENRLSVLQTASSLATYLYDGDGRKRVEIGASGRTTLVWDGWDYLQSYAGSKPLDYHTVDGLILAQRMDEDYAEYFPDFLGTVAAYADESGLPLAEARYKPYGLPLWSDGPVGDFAFGWVGQWGYRTSSDSIFVRARTLSVALGQWLTEDPIWPTEHVFLYAGGNPMTFIDPSGYQGVVIPPPSPPPRSLPRRGLIVPINRDNPRPQGKPPPRPFPRPVGTGPRYMDPPLPAYPDAPEYWIIPLPKPGEWPRYDPVVCAPNDLPDHCKELRNTIDRRCGGGSKTGATPACKMPPGGPRNVTDDHCAEWADNASKFKRCCDAREDELRWRCIDPKKRRLSGKTLVQTHWEEAQKCRNSENICLNLIKKHCR